jgi:hypothetical protein
MCRPYLGDWGSRVQISALRPRSPVKLNKVWEEDAFYRLAYRL